ncbi:DEAD/DEAH box helicase domain-containing protein [Theileria equi strain WA]|uniref:DEAD/DEAH box helicase domain-containing protein n=1 Tax=Theileria equi strain WA TaxID=1537102 RepID=L0AYR5_THEEQ|nr:DEAD/DEAH box helicase domain-containing protein [Theileria equi strain WA]AFZ80737.1 DEAD/DEAH box helicase domain-containing protein [Theileria equi strain WA]|eukprot:XP_004830403.1 DEAD/DEAH box helicase domain-containing protein [Theileria equi strain WA]
MGNTDYITSAYDLRIPWDGYLLKFQIKQNAASKKGSIESENSSHEDAEAAFVDSNDVGTFTWCLRNCQRICETNEHLTPAKIVGQILLLLGDDNVDRTASILCDTLGYAHVYFISKLLSFRQSLVKQWDVMLRKVVQKVKTNKLDATNYERLDKILLRQTGKDLERQKGKLEHILPKIPPQDLLFLVGLDLKSDVKLSHPLNFTQRTVLNLVREDHELYEKLTVPPPENIICAEDKELIDICTLPEWVQEAFSGIERLNLIQSRVFNSAFNTSQNLLVSAPTGCGKTNIALLCILQNYKQFFEENKKCGKVIYMVPMKALASEITEKYSKSLSKFGLSVVEVTGDVQLAKHELEDIDIMITTPEKFDVVTRNSFSTGTQSDESFMSRVSCLIIDEIHLLNDDRGPVIETIVARFFRLIESTQVRKRVVGISATLPNWEDIALFLRVSSEHTYYFGREYRYVPLEQVFYGVKQHDVQTVMLDLCFDHVVKTLESEKQCIIFVHSRNETLSTALKLIEMAQISNSFLFSPDEGLYKKYVGQLNKRIQSLRNLSEYSISIHHAGLVKSDRTLVEEMFKSGFIKVLVSTSTLAWGVNLPAHCVIIKGTFIGGAGVDRNINNLELTQIMGRAGRPQFDTSGLGILITEHKNLYNYMKMQTERVPIESKLHRHLENALNAEIAIGTIKNECEAILWLQYTYLYVRMFKNPLVYGITSEDENSILKFEQSIIRDAVKNLDKSRLLRLCKTTLEFVPTDLGRIAARYYVDYETTHNFAASINPLLYYEDGMLADRSHNISTDYINEEYILEVLCQCREFETLLFRNEECDELTSLMNSCCIFRPKSGIDHIKSKVCILIQAYISGANIKTPSLLSDLNFLIQNVGRLLRAYFEISACETVSGPPIGNIIHNWILMFERKCWNVKTRPNNVLAHFTHLQNIQLGKTPKFGVDESQKRYLLSENTARRFYGKFSLEELVEMTLEEISNIARSKGEAGTIKRLISHIPYPKIKLYNQPITSRISKVSISLSISIEWSKRWNGNVETFHVWICSRSRIISQSTISFTQSSLEVLEFYIPVHRVDDFLTVRIFSENWLGLVFEEQLRLHENLASSEGYTEIMDLIPLPTSVLGKYAPIYKFSHFNPLQTQIFPHCFMSDDNILVGAPTGSGKTLVAELAMLRLFDTSPGKKAVYIAPLKALAYERYRDWHSKFGKRVIEFTGDSKSQTTEVINSDIIITTPEKWDGVSRHWKKRAFVRSVGLIIIDEVHLLGESRGAVLESIVTRLSYMSDNTRLVCLSTALSNSDQVAEWLSVKPSKIFNFSPAVRPVKCSLFIDGFPIKPYCPRMNSMNKPAFDAISRHDPQASVLVFVSSRRQTRMTAQDFVGLLQLNSQTWANAGVSDTDIYQEDLTNIDDEYLRTFVAYGIGIHHAGLSKADRELVERLFLSGVIKVLVATSTLAWGVNLPAKIVIVKGTEFYDGRVNKYVDYSVTDIMQMVGRAGRSVYDNECFAYIYTETRKVGFYKAFMFSPFPTESFFHERILDCINSEVASGTIVNKKGAISYLSRTFFYKRLQTNMHYYLNIPTTSAETIFNPLANFSKEPNIEDVSNFAVVNTVNELVKLGCISLDYGKENIQQMDEAIFVPTLCGFLASHYYISCSTIFEFSRAASQAKGRSNLSFFTLMRILADAKEFSQVPVRHNEDIYNMQLSERAIFPIKESEASNPHAKTFLLFQARLFNLGMPIFDYNNDTKSVLDQTPRVIQTLVDIFAAYRNFKNVQYILFLYKCLSCGLDPRNLNLAFDTNSVNFKLLSLKLGEKRVVRKRVISLKYSCFVYDIEDTSDLELVVSVDLLDSDEDSIHYLVLANEHSNFIYGFKRFFKSGTAYFGYVYIM